MYEFGKINAAKKYNNRLVMSIQQVYYNQNYILFTRHDIFSMTFVNFEIALK